MLAGFDSFLRTGEMLSLTFADLNVDEEFHGAIRLEHTKTGQRHAAFEASVIADPLVGRMFRAVQRAQPGGTHEDHYVYPGSQHAFYKAFHEGLAWLGVADAGFQPCSVRRGGATAFSGGPATWKRLSIEVAGFQPAWRGYMSMTVWLKTSSSSLSPKQSHSSAFMQVHFIVGCYSSDGVWGIAPV